MPQLQSTGIAEKRRKEEVTFVRVYMYIYTHLDLGIP